MKHRRHERSPSNAVISCFCLQCGQPSEHPQCSSNLPRLFSSRGDQLQSLPKNSRTQLTRNSSVESLAVHVVHARGGGANHNPLITSSNPNFLSLKNLNKFRCRLRSLRETCKLKLARLHLLLHLHCRPVPRSAVQSPAQKNQHRCRHPLPLRSRCNMPTPPWSSYLLQPFHQSVSPLRSCVVVVVEFHPPCPLLPLNSTSQHLI